MTNDDRTIELMNLAIDGQATPAQLAELQQILVSSVEARVTYESLQGLAAELDAEHAMEAPPTMKEDILAALRAKHRVVPFLSTRAKKRVMAAAAAAAFLALALVAIVRRDTVDGRDAAAAMGARASQGVIEEAANGARIRVRFGGGTVEVEASGPAGAEVVWDPATLRLLESPPELSDTPQIAQSGKLPLAPNGSRRIKLSSDGAPEAGNTIAVAANGRELVRATIPK